MAEQRQQVVGVAASTDNEGLHPELRAQSRETELEGQCGSLSLEVCHSDTLPHKAIPPKPLQTAPTIGDQVYKCLRWMGISYINHCSWALQRSHLMFPMKGEI